MRLIFFVFIFLLISAARVLPQNTFKAIVRDADSDEPLIGVNIVFEGTGFGAATNDSGYAEIKNIPDGSYNIVFSSIGYEKTGIELNFPIASGQVFNVGLELEAEEIEEVFVTSTRGSRLIEDEPTRVEVIAGEEIDEKISMDPSNISMLLSESTGIQVQQTSASSVNNSFKIQGLDGRYTQLLKDGFPLYTGFSGSLSISQVLPLDLRQIEVIKGSSSTLYGGGAIAGLINLVTKIPQRERELSMLLNLTSALAFDISGFYSHRFENYGFSLFASRNTQRAYDSNDDNFSDLPQIERYTLKPNVFLYLGEKSTLQAGGTIMTEDRLGGSIPIIRGESNSVNLYTEENNTERASSLLRFDHQLDGVKTITLKNSIGYFKRKVILPGYLFAGKQVSSFTEMTYSSSANGLDWIIGLNFLTDDFTDESPIQAKRDYSDITAGLFLQNTLDISEMVSIESGLRTDFNKDYNWFFLPRISLLLKLNNSITSRLGGGLGYKIPNIFSEDAEELSFNNVLPLNKNKVNAERSFGANFDVNYRTIVFSAITLSINQLFFYTRINDPAVVSISESAPNIYEYITLPGHLDSRGAETNIKITYGHYKLFIGYTFVDARIHRENSIEKFPLTPEHRLGLVLIYEKHGDYRIGLEGYYTGKQKLSNGESTTDYWINGLMIEKRLGKISLFLNFENVLDTRQSKFGQVYTGSPANPEFAEIFAPTDGRIINGGIKWSF